MKLSKTALRELSAKYRAVLMKCALMNMMIFTGALMPHTAEAYTRENRTITVANDSTLRDPLNDVDKIVFTNDCTLDGKGNYIIQNRESPTIIEGNGTLKDIWLKSMTGFKGNDNTLSIAGSVHIAVGKISKINFNLLDGSSLTLSDTGDTVLSGGTLSITGNAAFLGALENSTIRISDNYIWSKDSMQLNYVNSSGNTLELDSSKNPVTLTMEDDIAIDTVIQSDKSSTPPQSVTISGNGNTLSVKELKAAYTNNFYFDNVKIKSDTLLIENLINLKNNTSVTISKDLTFADYDARIIGDGTTAIYFENDEATISSGKLQNVSLFAKNKLTTNSVFIGTNITAKTVDISSSHFLEGDNTIISDEILAKDSLRIGYNDTQASLTLKKSDGTRGVLKMDDAAQLKLFGKFTGDVTGGKITVWESGAEFYGKMNVAELEMNNSAFSVSPLKGSYVETLNIYTTNSNSGVVSSIRITSDLSANSLNFENVIERYSSSALEKIAGKISGNGTLKINNASVQIASAEQLSPDKTAYFDGINIAALNNNLTFSGDREAKYDFTSNAISAAGKIEFNTPTTFHGASILTAQSIKAKAVALDGTLTVSGVLQADKITGGTLNIVLPETAGTSPIITADAKDVTLTLDLKSVKGKEAQKYRLTNTKDGYTVSGDYGKYAFSADGDFADYRADKDAFSFANAWKNSDGTLWVMRISGGAQAAIDDLRAAGIFVSPVEENASKILEMANNNPFADALTALLDSGNPALQKQALREVVPTDAAASAFKSAKNTANAVMNAVSGRLGGSSEVSGRSGGDLTVGESSVWVQGMLNHAKMTGGFKADTAGFAAGVETNLTDEIKAGFGYAYASTDIKTDRSKTDAYTHTGFVYGEYAPDALYVNAMLSFGRSDYDDKAKLSGMKNSYKADTYSARVATGYALGVLTPEAALRFTAVRQKAYTDALGARVSAKSLNTATMVAGAKAAKTFTAGKYAVTPEAKAALTYDLARPNEDRTVTLPDGSSYVAAGEKLNRLGFEIGAKAAVRLTNAVEVSLSYDGAFKEHYQDHTGLMNLKLSF